MHPYRTHTCGALRASHVGQTVRLGGWLFRMRDQKHQVFVDLRDHHGVTQVVFDETQPALMERVRSLRAESVLIIDGAVIAREKKNDKLATGDIEVKATALNVDSEVKHDNLPLQVAIPKGENDRDGEETRLTYRFLDLRRERIHKNIVLRDRIIRHMRDHMHSEGFVEFQTPILTNSSPEGARDYLVPSRVHPGKFFALPQAPQQWKQLLMCSGFDRYFQIAPCFRDEDARADRAPGEFYQLDLEMAFAVQEDVFGVIERMYRTMPDVVAAAGGPKKKIVHYPFPRLQYWDCIDKYGSDKPDLRIPLEIVDVSDTLRGTSFGLFKDVLAAPGGRVKALRLPGLGKDGKGAVRKLEKAVQEKGYKGLPNLIYKAGEVDGSIKKGLSPAEVEAVRAATGAQPDDLVVFGMGTRLLSAKVLGEVRLIVGREQLGPDNHDMYFLFVVDFPFYEKDDEGKVQFSHNPFSMPQGGLEALNTKDPLEINAYQYDIVCNGTELSSGAIRNHRPDIMYRAWEIVGYSREDTKREFGHMIAAFEYGAPPHGGMAPGVDRSVMLFLDEPNIREVVAFPKNQKCQDLLVNAPSFVRQKQLDELHIKLNLPPGVEDGTIPNPS